MRKNVVQREVWVVAGESRPNLRKEGAALTTEGMPLDTALDGACQRWLRARNRFYREDGANALEELADAENELLAVFASDWSGNQMQLIAAYREFRQALAGAVEDRCQPNGTN